MINPNNNREVVEAMEDILEIDIPLKSVESLTERQKEWFVKLYTKYTFSGVDKEEVIRVAKLLINT